MWSLTVGNALITGVFVGMAFGGEVWVGEVLESCGSNAGGCCGVRRGSEAFCPDWIDDEDVSLGRPTCEALPRFLVF